MCGVAGIFDFGGRLEPDRADLALDRMTAALRHRGPDAGGRWDDRDANIWIGHRRLSIIDLTETGSQPMTSADGRWVISYNGEVYNAAELRAILSEETGLRFRGTSDTEAVLEAIAHWGVTEAVSRCRGMFALAVWNRPERRLFLVRDRLGIKPLYFSHREGIAVFASELRAVLASALVPPVVDRAGLASYLRYRYVPAPGSILRDVSKVEPGMIVTLAADGRVSRRQFWSLEDRVLNSESRNLCSEDEAVSRLSTLIDEAVACRLVSDVPLGAFLSGGIDSSLVVSSMQRISPEPVRTFTIAFDDPRHNEGDHARGIADFLGTRHLEFKVTARNALDCVEDLHRLCDEPMADSSLLPTYIVSKLAREHVTVCLSGDGGDESFAGYNRYAGIIRTVNAVGGLPRGMRHALAGVVGALPIESVERLVGKFSARRNPRLFSEQFAKLARILRADGVNGMYLAAMTDWTGSVPPVLGVEEDGIHTLADRLNSWQVPPLSRMQLADSLTYLPDDILTKVDRASMAVSLEARVPLLDHHVVEYAWQLPESMKLQGKTGKWLLRKVLAERVPRDLWDRPKKGFSVPVADWLRGELRDWTMDLLEPSKLASAGLLDPDAVTSLLNDHLSGRADHAEALWSLLVFQQWHDRTIEVPAS